MPLLPAIQCRTRKKQVISFSLTVSAQLFTGRQQGQRSLAEKQNKCDQDVCPIKLPVASQKPSIWTAYPQYCKSQSLNPYLSHCNESKKKLLINQASIINKLINNAAFTESRVNNLGTSSIVCFAEVCIFPHKTRQNGISQHRYKMSAQTCDVFSCLPNFQWWQPLEKKKKVEYKCISFNL